MTENDVINIVASIINKGTSDDQISAYKKLEDALRVELNKIIFLEFIHFFTKDKESILGEKGNLKKRLAENIQLPGFELGALKNHVGSQKKRPFWVNRKTKELISENWALFNNKKLPDWSIEFEKFQSHIIDTYRGY